MAKRFLQTIKGNGMEASVAFCASIAMLVVIDWVIKTVLYRAVVLPPWRNEQWIGLAGYQNPGFVWGIAVPGVVYAALGALVVFLFLVVWQKWIHLVFYERVGWLFVFAGAIANLLERLWSGGVRDYLVIWRGIYNLADLYIIIGILILLFVNKKHV